MSIWYKLVIAGRDEYLRSLGIGEDNIAYINSITDPQAAQFAINQLRQNPLMQHTDLRALPLPQKVQPYTQQEMENANPFPEPMRTWVLVQFKKHRSGKSKHFYNCYDYNYSGLPQHPDEHHYRNDINTRLREIKDWWQATGAQLASYSLEQACVASDAWHLQMSGMGDGQNYQERNIVYGPDWNEPKWKGWTVQLVKTENDLEVEGNKMGHCVSSYSEKVEAGKCKIFSLRDPQNEPHATIETDASGKDAEQIRGKSNAEPIDQYKAMIKEWVGSGRGPINNNESNYDYDDYNTLEISLEACRVNEMDEILDKAGQEYDDYGLKQNASIDVESVFDTVLRRLHDRSSGDYSSWMKHVANSLVALCKRTGDLQELEKLLYKNEEENQDYLFENIDSYMEHARMPDKDDYASDEEFQQAEKEYEKKRDEAADYIASHYLPYAFIYDCFRALNSELHPPEKVASNWYRHIKH